jgi:phosphate uptake regulator
MESRKLILFGTNSYVISLPRSWIEGHNLKKGDSIQLNELEGDIIVQSGKPKIKEIKQILIKIEDKEIAILRTEIITAYLKGFNEINIQGSLTNIISDLRKIVMKLPGLEVMQLTSDNMKLTNLLNESNVSINEIFSRTCNMLLTMIDDSIKCLNEKIHDSIVERDNDINRMVFLSFRVLRKALNDKSLANDLNLTNEDIITKWQMFLRLEKIGDHNKRIARLLALNEIKNKDIIENIYLKLKLFFTKLVDAYETKNRKNLIIIATNGKKEIINISDDLIKLDSNYINFKIVENFKNMSVSIEQIAQVLLTRLDD